MKLNSRAMTATGWTVAWGSGLLAVLQQLAKHPERILTVVLPIAVIVALIYVFWAKRLR